MSSVILTHLNTLFVCNSMLSSSPHWYLHHPVVAQWHPQRNPPLLLWLQPLYVAQHSRLRDSVMMKDYALSLLLIHQYLFFLHHQEQSLAVALGYLADMMGLGCRNLFKITQTASIPFVFFSVQGLFLTHALVHQITTYWKQLWIVLKCFWLSHVLYYTPAKGQLSQFRIKK